MNIYYDRQGRPIDQAEAMRLFDAGPDERRIAHDPVVIGDEVLWVSTVHLVINHQWDERLPPLIFETMIFGGPDDLDLECWRYPTEEAALAGHDRVMAMLAERASR